VARSGGDAAVVRIRNNKGLSTNKALAITTDCTPRYCYADPVEGGKQAVAETWRNLTAVGAIPLAITNCLNFGNPEKPEIMGQIVGCLQGMSEACDTLDYPIVSGNVSLYNETSGVAILPTPAIGGVGILYDIKKRVGNAFVAENEHIILVGITKGHLGASLYLREILGREEGAPPPVDLKAEMEIGDFVRYFIREGKITACHDISDGGLLVALAEMTYRNGIGADITATGDAGFWFGEDQARYIVTVKSAAEFLASTTCEKIPAVAIGKTKIGELNFEGNSIKTSELKSTNEKWLPSYME